MFKSHTPAPEPTEVTGHNLLDEYAAAVEAFQAQIDAIAADAEDRALVVEFRLQELEAEKQVLSQLKEQPVALVARRPVVDAPQA